MSAALKEDFRCSSNQAALASPSLVEVPQLLLWLLVTSDHVPPLFQTRLTQRKAKVFSMALDTPLTSSPIPPLPHWRPRYLLPMPCRLLPQGLCMCCSLCLEWGYPNASGSKNLPARWETWVQSLGWEEPLEKGMATHSCILPWRIPWTEAPGWLQSMGSQSGTRLSD